MIVKKMNRIGRNYDNFTAHQLLFYVFSMMAITSAIGVISLKIQCAPFCLWSFTFFNVAAIWMLLEAEFLAIALSACLCWCGDGVIFICGDDDLILRVSRS